MPNYYQYHPTYKDWTGITTEIVGTAYTTDVPVSVGAGLTQTYTGTNWSTTTDYSGTYYFTSGDDIGDAIAWSSPVEPPSLTTTTTPPSISTAGYTYSWSGTAWSVVPKATLPEGDEVMSLGASGNAYKDLFVSEGTVYLGVHTLSVASNRLSYDGEEVITGVGGTFETDFAHLAEAEIGLATVTTLTDGGNGQIDLDTNLIPSHNRTFNLGAPQKSWEKVYVKGGPKAIEFENTSVGLGYTVNAQGEKLLEFDGHELFAGDGDIGHHGNLVNIYATGIISSTGATIGIVTATEFHGDGSELTNIVADSGQVEVLYADVRNTSGSPIDAGTPVYITGYNAGSDRYEIAPADAGNSSTMPAAGILKTTLADSSNGEIGVYGQVTSLDTSDYSDGDELWVAVGAGLTSVRPTGASELVQKIGQVLRAHASTGVILIKGAGRTNDTPNSVTSQLTETTSTTDNATRYVTFVPNNTTGAGQTVFTNTDLKYNPSTGDLTVSGDVLTSSVTASTLYPVGGGTVSVAASLVPSTDNTYDLGTVANRWKDLYLDGGQAVLNIGDVGIGVTDGHLVIDGREALDLNTQGDIGQAGRLRNIYATGVVTASSFSTGNEAMTFDVVGTDLIISVAGIGSTTLALS